MNQITVMRILRTKYGISLKEFAEAACVTTQHISRLELGIYPYSTKNQEMLMQQAFEKIITQKTRQVEQLAASFAANRHRLLELVTEENNHEL